MTPVVIPITRHLAQENDELRKTVLALVEGIERALACIDLGDWAPHTAGATYELTSVLPPKGTQ